MSLLGHVRREQTMAAREKIEREQQWWLRQPLDLRVKYQGQYVAVHNQEMVDHDVDENELHQRIRVRYGSMPILIMPAEGPPDLHIYSPRLEHA